MAMPIEFFVLGCPKMTQRQQRLSQTSHFRTKKMSDPRRKFAIDEARALLERNGVSVADFAVATGLLASRGSDRALPRLLTKASVIEALGVSKATFYRHFLDRLPVVRVGGTEYIDPQDVDALITSSKATSPVDQVAGSTESTSLMTPGGQD